MSTNLPASIRRTFQSDTSDNRDAYVTKYAKQKIKKMNKRLLIQKGKKFIHLDTQKK
jgi:hypothetical protein